MRAISLACLFVLAGASWLAAASAVSAQALAPPGSPAPAAPTARSGPDGDRSYRYPPDTGALVRPEDRSSATGQGEERPRPADDPPGIPGLSNRPASEVGR